MVVGSETSRRLMQNALTQILPKMPEFPALWKTLIKMRKRTVMSFGIKDGILVLL
jgi:hypothetical protein